MKETGIFATARLKEMSIGTNFEKRHDLKGQALSYFS